MGGANAKYPLTYTGTEAATGTVASMHQKCPALAGLERLSTSGTTCRTGHLDGIFVHETIRGCIKNH